ncbi:hypothetical protein [Agromyces lapidis]|uniref:Uncharacterized protein n=1 Tax=Agromyces lapidis TaxID=279574 RepID=A0ABV5SMD1_9MICO|nr:hypothetical protein [Agromyces lapidis]
MSKLGAAEWVTQPDDRLGSKNVLDGAFDPIPDDVQRAALATVTRFAESASLAELVAMLGLSARGGADA